MASFSIGDILRCKRRIEYSLGLNYYETKTGTNYLVIDYVDPDWILNEYVLVSLGRKPMHSFKLSELDVEDKDFEKVGHVDVRKDEKLEELLRNHKELEPFVR